MIKMQWYKKILLLLKHVYKNYLPIEELNINIWECLSEDLLDKNWRYLKPKTLYHAMYIGLLDSVVYLGILGVSCIIMFNQIFKNSTNKANRKVIA